jgi:exodeoxyribonuclease V alpha subunit
LKDDLLIVDETSMVSNDLMARLLEAIENPTKVLMVGDQDQLPSVGEGAVLRDMLNSGKIPYTQLMNIHRNAGDIVKACHRIKHGEFYQPSPNLDLEQGFNLRHIERGSKDAIARTIEELVCERMPARGYDPIWDVQVISPVNSKTVISCDALNKTLQKRLNPAADPERRYSPKDKVIRIKNSRVEAIVDDDTPPVEEYIVNGDLGQVAGINGCLDIDFLYPNRRVKLPTKDKNLRLAYCITCHRMQGSEAPVVIVPVDKSFSFFMSRPWIYTAISRAQKICITVGQFEAIKTAIKRPATDERITRLVQLGTIR